METPDANGRASLVRTIAGLRADPSRPFHTSEASRALGLEPSAFIRQFKQLTGLSPLRFRAALRIQIAKTLLITTRMPVTEISLEVGYNSLGTFVRTFSEMVGLSPTRFRNLADCHPLGDIGDLPEAQWVSPEAAADAVDIVGVVEPFEAGLSFVMAAGLFREAVPAGWPIDGCLRVGPGQFRLSWPRSLRRVSLLVAALPERAVREDIWAPPSAELWVYSRELRHTAVGGRRRLELRVQLRRVRETDPPILTPLPMLLTQQQQSTPLEEQRPSDRAETSGTGGRRRKGESGRS